MPEWIWFDKKDPIESLKQHRQTLGGLGDALGIQLHSLEANKLVLKMQIAEIHKQPIGIVHGGTYCALAETVGSVASNLTLDYSKQYSVGQQINVYYFRPSRSGLILAEASPSHLGRKTQIWQIKMCLAETKKTLSEATLTMAVLKHDK